MYDPQVQPTTSALAVTATGLGKRFGDLWALRHLDLAVPTGSVLGLLGHNGAGKTTAIRILTTLTQPSEGVATVAGHDVATGAEAVRRRIGVAAQQATVDELLTARWNLVMVGRLHGLDRRTARQRAGELLEQFSLAAEGDQLVKTYSGGMRRRLDLAASLVAQPTVLFLDEPTTGLDPRSRNDLWEVLRDLVRDGVTVLLTTQYLDEADRLADDIVVLDHGAAVAHGTPADLKAQVGGDRIEVTVRTPSELPSVAAVMAPFVSQSVTLDDSSRQAILPVGPDVRLIDVVRALDSAGIDAIDLNRRQATLDDVFLALTSPAAPPRSEVSA